jgi:hypothetical protein
MYCIYASASPASASPRFYFVNLVTGDAQWDAPLFTARGTPPSLQDFAVCHGPENDPTTWLRVEAIGSAP